MAINYEIALQHFREWTQTEPLRRHARSVEFVMRASAQQYGDGANVEKWAITGLLHDGDYEKWPEDHPHRMVEWLNAHEEPEIAHAVSCHYSKWGIPCVSQLDKALLAADEISGFVSACALIRPEGIATLTVNSVKKKLGVKSFAAKVDREEIRLGCELLGITIDEHLHMVLEALRPHASELGLMGRA
jgi:predicted hydrolase (HD superfamily)